jgi:cellobiose-specific phosphotransferase system component IIB
MIVYICCAGGLTSSLFCSKIRTAAKEENIIVDDIFTILDHYEEYQKQYDLILAYGPISFLTLQKIKNYNLENLLVSVWIAPQVWNLKGPLCTLLEPFHIPVYAIDMRTFGIMDGKKALDDIKSKL